MKEPLAFISFPVQYMGYRCCYQCCCRRMSQWVLYCNKRSKVSWCSQVRKSLQPLTSGFAWQSQWGPGVFLWNINNFTECQTQTRSLCDYDRSRQKQDHSITVSERRQNMNIANYKNDQLSPILSRVTADSTNHSLNLRLVVLSF